MLYYKINELQQNSINITNNINQFRKKKKNFFTFPILEWEIEVWKLLLKILKFLLICTVTWDEELTAVPGIFQA